LGWQRKGGTTLGSEVEDKVWAAKDGELVGPVKIAGGLALVVPEAGREGDIPFEQARPEIAESELRQERSQARAKASAEAALAKAKAEPSKSLKDLFPAPDSDDKAGKNDTLHAEETGLYSRRGSMVQGIGPAPTVAKAAFELSSEAPLGGPFQELGSFIVVKLKEHQKPDMAEFEKEKQRMADEAAQQKGSDGRDGLGAAALPGGERREEDRREPGSSALRGRARGCGGLRALFAAAVLTW
jgi:hypothetical protein